MTLLEKGTATSVAFTGPLTGQLDERQYARGYGPRLASIDGGEVVRIDRMKTEQRWRDWVTEASAQGVGSSLSIPCRCSERCPRR